jgi:hypothetical protein
VRRFIQKIKLDIFSARKAQDVRRDTTSRQHHSPGLISGFSGGKKKYPNKNFDNHITTIYLALIPKLTVATMVMFLSFNEIPTFSGPKSGGAS